jgi:hypothetical protein
MLKEKILNSEKLTEDEVRFLTEHYSGKEISWEEWNEIEVEDTISGENRRWSAMQTVVLRIGNRYFTVDYDEGLTESQENSYYEQVAVEVIKKERIAYDWVVKQ